MNPERLWAKSWDSKFQLETPRSAHFVEHLKDVLAAADRVLAATGDDQLAALGLPVEHFRVRFRRIVRLAAAIHDLGKANDHFQSMVRGQRDRETPQGLRHEWVTILMLEHLRQWLLPAVQGSELDVSIAEWAVAGHHPATQHQSPPRERPEDTTDFEISLHVNHLDYAEALEWLRSVPDFDLRAVPHFNQELRLPLIGADSVYASLAIWERAALRSWESLKRSPDRLMVPAVKNCLIAADIAGSALPKLSFGDSSLWNWIDKSFDSRPKSGDLQLIAQHRLGANNTKRDFQLAVEKSRDRVTYVKAGCGSGKTLAAYLWAAKNCPERRLYFCYPTTGTATEGFKDYLFPHESDVSLTVDSTAQRVRELGSQLFHSRRDVDFEIILTTGQDTPRAESETAIRIDALEAWSTPIVACTVDTVLGIVQNNKRGLLGWPALAQSAFVFDEIHAFDDRLFGALLRFLRDLPGLPVLLMTASLPKAREEALRRVLEKLRPEPFRQDFVAIPGPTELEELPRYHRQHVEKNDPLPTIVETLRTGGKVLWVCNTVSRVMEAAARAEAAGLTPLIYHSRFRYEDRVARHKNVVEAFTPQTESAVLAITSQVCEMSLDLKGCTLLVSDLSSTPSAIQRLGRLNRFASSGAPTRPFIIVEPDTHLPYTPADLLAARIWLDKLPEKISQRHLADRWEQTGDQPPALIESAWLDGGPITTVSELREASPGISVLMTADQPAVQERPRDLGRYVLPMPPPPKWMNWKDWSRERGIPIAPEGSILYDKLRGAEWQRR